MKFFLILWIFLIPLCVIAQSNSARTLVSTSADGKKYPKAFLSKKFTHLSLGDEIENLKQNSTHLFWTSKLPGRSKQVCWYHLNGHYKVNKIPKENVNSTEINYLILEVQNVYDGEYYDQYGVYNRSKKIGSLSVYKNKLHHFVKRTPGYPDANTQFVFEGDFREL